ncbi:hypothetical protein [Gordonia hydrophobica]|uniref:Fibronectin type III domain-containing protein n=1 Tax=Gordonia hydrophobica TaxID=40516 RepID=A0ABZ2U3I2_9ACTN|nr:hypothetical protein [Gordonia hydrophobica]MBM7367534.1 hypothetical protein [Gordonia hydrophobica]
MSSPMTPTGRTTIPAKTLAIIAAIAVLVLIASLFVVRAVTGSAAPDTPTGLSLSYDKGTVKAAWNRVSGADEYVLIRDDGVVVYSGGDSTAEDPTAPTGEHRYRVRASDSGRWSGESPETTVTVTSGWGQSAPFMAEFPQLLPQTPQASGWEGLTCRSMVRALKAERGPSDAGAGEPMVKLRMHCFNSEIVVQPGWMTSKNAVDRVLSDLTKTAKAESISWRYGTGYVVEDEHTAYLRFSDRDDLMFVVTVDKADEKGILDVVNAMPLDK